MDGENFRKISRFDDSPQIAEHKTSRFLVD